MGSLQLDTLHLLDADSFSKECDPVLRFLADYYRDIEQHPVRSEVEPGYLSERIPGEAPTHPQPIDAILDDVRNDILPGLSHWQSPNFFAYFQTTASTAGFVGEMLCSGLNVVGFSWISSPAATELESIVMDWMGKMLRLPNAFLFSGGEGGGGVMHGSTCEAVVCTLAAARDRALREIGHVGVARLTVYVSDQTHFTVRKAARLVGIPPSNFRVIPTSAASGYALTAGSVCGAIEEDVAAGLVPLYLCATVGTTAVGAVDPLPDVGRVAQRYGVWVHVDAAYAGSAGICPEFRQYFDGVELADSLSMNLHKWFLTNLDCCCLWLKSPNDLIEAMGTDAEVLRNKASEAKSVVDYKDWQIALSRRFRAIKLWVVIRRYGVARLMEHIRSDVALAEHFERLVAADERFEVAAPRRFALVCFRLREDGGEESAMNRELLEAVNASGRAFMTHAVVAGAFVLRFAVGATLTEMRHVDATWELIQAKATEVLLRRL